MIERLLALGSAQFGMPYGVANRSGQVALEEVRAILHRARTAGVDMIDTAVAYGTSEERLGRVGVADWAVVSKLPPVPLGCDDVESWARDCVAASLRRMRIAQLDGLLVHAPEQLLDGQGPRIHRALVALREQGLTRRIGVSIYGPEILGGLLDRFEFDLVQAPFSVLDRRLLSTGWLETLARRGIEVHARSLFLQGVLLMDRAARPAAFARWNELWEQWHGWLQENGLNAVEACIGFVAAHPGIRRAVVGVDCLGQLEQILAVRPLRELEFPEALARYEQDLVDPSRWKLAGAA